MKPCRIIVSKQPVHLRSAQLRASGTHDDEEPQAEAGRYVTRASPRAVGDPRATLCHTFGSQLIQSGASIVYVKEQMGHGSIQVTVDIYGHLIPGANVSFVDRLDIVPAKPEAKPEPNDTKPVATPA
jgi:hypothetical protein